MQQKHTLRLTLLIGLFFLLLSGCDKKIDKLPDESTLCSVRTITSPALNPEEVGGPTDTIRFSYDSYGNPVSIVRLETATELNDYIFRYDHQHRLTDIIGTFGPGANDGDGFDTWQKLYYKDGRIMLDTTFDFGFIRGTRPIPFLPQDSSLLIRRISTFEYDPEGRISRARDTVPGGFAQISLYSYDRNGNLTKISAVFPPDTVATLYTGFDNKVNPDRTNPIWQFLDRNYSMNLQYSAKSYNQIGLPTAFPGDKPLPVNLLPRPFSAALNIYPQTITYTCDYN